MSDNHDTPDNLPAGREDHTPAEHDEVAPGLPAHQWRPTDVDPRAEKRAERQVATMFALSMVFAVLFVVAYFSFEIGDTWDTFMGLGTSNLALGTTFGLALLLIGIGIIQWARKLMADHEIAELRHPAASSEEDREATLSALRAGLEESGIGRRPLLRNSMLGAVGLLGLPAVVLLRDMGPLPFSEEVEHHYGGLRQTVWTKGMRIARDVIGTPIKPEELQVGDLVNAEPMIMFETDEHGEPVMEGHEVLVAKSKAATILLRMEPEDINHAPDRENWTVEGIVAYSKICTHVGCPISLNERTTHHLLCPCHQSTFDLADAGRVVFGPAARALPQLPIAVDAEGYLVAQSDYKEPVGPSFWERG